MRPRARGRACRSDSVVTSPVATFFRSTVFFCRSMATASQFVRTSTPKIARNICSVATRSLPSSGITPPTWYGSPQFAYETYGPRSTMTISAFSSSRRSRAAQDAPPATPPTMTTFMVFLPLRPSGSGNGSAHAVDRREEIGDDRALEDELVRARVERHPAHVRLVVDAQDDDLRGRGSGLAALAATPGPCPCASERSTTATSGWSRVAPSRSDVSSATMTTVSKADSRRPRNAFRQAVVAIGEEDATRGRFRSFERPFLSRNRRRERSIPGHGVEATAGRPGL